MKNTGQRSAECFNNAKTVYYLLYPIISNCRED